ncbi:MAG: TonB-dependent receptor [Alphaproteobacteria bacterium]|nr:TonB-dependent receptor [Alphaproteobacteria bacterium]
MMLAQAPPAVTQTESQSEVIEVVATRPDQGLKVDRRTYRVLQTPHSAQKDAVQLLRGLPAVTITSDDQILLLGSGTPKILIDGRPYAGDARKYLRTLHGTDIERIEIMTNPSAQFSAEGTGGIINLVLRKQNSADTSGNVSFEASTFRRLQTDLTLKGKQGPLAYELTAGGNVGWQSRWSFERRRGVRATPAGEESMVVENGNGGYRGTDGRLNGKLTYDLGARTSVSASVVGGGGVDELFSAGNLESPTPGSSSVSERRVVRSVASFLTAGLNVEHKGERDGDTFSIAAQLYGNPQVRDATTARFGDGSSFSAEERKKALETHIQTDWARQVGKGQLLSLGGSWDLNTSSFLYRFASQGAGAALGLDTADQYEATSSTLAAYASFQQSLGKLTVLAGIRGERNTLEVTSFAPTGVKTDRTHLFPSAHIKYVLGKGLDLTASYSKRIDRVPLQYLRPYGSVEDSVTLFEGNPHLRDQSTDAYEMNLHYRAKKVEAGVIAYVRQTNDLWSKSYSVTGGGAATYTYVNAGRRQDSGAQVDVSAPLLPRVKANASINLFHQRGPIETEAGRQTYASFRYTTTGTLQWTSPDRGKVPGDVAQLQWTYNGPSRSFQLRELAWYDVTLSYTRSFTRELSLSATFRYQGPYRYQLSAPLIREEYSRRRSPEFSVKLLRTFGRH